MRHTNNNRKDITLFIINKKRQYEFNSINKNIIMKIIITEGQTNTKLYRVASQQVIKTEEI